MQGLRRQSSFRCQVERLEGLYEGGCVFDCGLGQLWTGSGQAWPSGILADNTKWLRNGSKAPLIPLEAVPSLDAVPSLEGGTPEEAPLHLTRYGGAAQKQATIVARVTVGSEMGSEEAEATHRWWLEQGRKG